MYALTVTFLEQKRLIAEHRDHKHATQIFELQASKVHRLLADQGTYSLLGYLCFRLHHRAQPFPVLFATGVFLRCPQSWTVALTDDATTLANIRVHGN